MIRIRKPAKPPAVLESKGKAEAQKLRDVFDAARDDYIQGRLKFEFDSTIYGAKSVKNVLKNSQHEKCAFCESKFTSVSYGDVEHFRPKGGYRQRDGQPLQYPGYYWLAYEWSNLYLTCQICNQRHKKNYFPLADPARRALSHHDDVVDEKPLLVNLNSDEPEQFIGFREEYAFAIAGQIKGETTIEVLGLNREALVEVRRDHLTLLRQLKESNDLLSREILHAESLGREPPAGFRDLFVKNQNLLFNQADEKSPYCSMSRAALG